MSGKKHKLTHVLDRTAAATGISRAPISRIKTEEDVQNWPFQRGSQVQFSQYIQVPESFAIIVLKVIRDLFIEKNVVPSVNRIYERISSLKERHVLDLNLFFGIVIPTNDSKLRVWSRSTFHRFMRKIVFVYDHRLTRYEYTKKRQDIIKMRDNCLEWGGGQTSKERSPYIFSE